jgi:toxin ParE1/3/4
VKLSLVVHPRAELDLIECFEYLAQHSPSAARRFLDATEASLATINQRPGDGYRYFNDRRPKEDWRYVRLPGFKKHLVIYRITETEVEVVRIVHGSRDLESILRVL